MRDSALGSRSFDVRPSSEQRLEWEIGDIGEVELQSLANQHSELRDRLAYQKLVGTQLTAREALLLNVLNEITRRAMPARERISTAALEAAAFARRMRARRPR